VPEIPITRMHLQALNKKRHSMLVSPFMKEY